MCPSLEYSDLVFQETGDSKNRTHSRPSECVSRQAIQARSDHPDRMVSPSRHLPSNMIPVAPDSRGPACHQVQQQATKICFTGFRPPGLGNTQTVLEGSESICLLSGRQLGQSGGEVVGLSMQQDHPDCSRVAKHALSSQIPLCLPNLLTQLFNQILHRNLLKLNLLAWLLEPQLSWTRASQALPAQIEAPQ